MDPQPLPLERIDDKVPVLAVRIGESRALAIVVDTRAEHPATIPCRRKGRLERAGASREGVIR
jgi:hypothetical protein